MFPGLEAFAVPNRVPTRVSSGRVSLRKYGLQDLDEFYTLHYTSYPGHLEPWSPIKEESASESRKSARKHILAALDKWDEGSDYRFFVALDKTNQIVGQLGITTVIRGVSQSAHIGYWIGKQFLNQGYATEAVVLALQFAFDELHLHRVSLWISPDNKASLRVVEKLGFRLEGKAERALFLGGTWRDTSIFAITLEEWEMRKAELRGTFFREDPGKE